MLEFGIQVNRRRESPINAWLGSDVAARLDPARLPAAMLFKILVIENDIIAGSSDFTNDGASMSSDLYVSMAAIICATQRLVRIRHKLPNNVSSSAKCYQSNRRNIGSGEAAPVYVPAACRKAHARKRNSKQ